MTRPCRARWASSFVATMIVLAIAGLFAVAPTAAAAKGTCDGIPLDYHAAGAHTHSCIGHFEGDGTTCFGVFAAPVYISGSVSYWPVLVCVGSWEYAGYHCDGIHVEPRSPVGGTLPYCVPMS